MKLGTDLIKKKFDDIEKKVDFLIERCETLQIENHDLMNKTIRLEAELEKKDNVESQFSEQEGFIQSKVDMLLNKLNNFSNSTTVDG
jgi:hypothetical protein